MDRLKELSPYLPWIATGVALGTSAYLALKLCHYCNKGCANKGQINPIIRKDCPKVADTIDVEDLGEKASFCRCWLSKKWPYCDGAHKEHNEKTGDNVGPLRIKRKTEEK